jgi:hypothetical protein
MQRHLFKPAGQHIGICWFTNTTNIRSTTASAWLAKWVLLGFVQKSASASLPLIGYCRQRAGRDQQPIWAQSIVSETTTKVYISVPKEYYILAVGLALEKKQSTILIKYKPTGILINVTLYANKLAALLTINQILPINGKEIYNLQIDFLLKRKNL